MHCVQTYTFSTLEEVPALAQMLAAQFPHPELALTGIHELLVNAIEHGNLEIGFELKAELFRTGRWHMEISQRLAMPHYASRRAGIEIVRSPHECRLSITDQGKGFAWNDYLSKPIPDTSLNGRGLLMAMHSGFDSVTYNTSGNTVTCSCRS